jgi:hypothetical protein
MLQDAMVLVYINIVNLLYAYNKHKKGILMSEALPTDRALSTSELDMLRQQQENILTHIRTFVQGSALSLDLYGAEKELFKLVLTLGRALLGEVIARHGSGKVDHVANASGQRLPYQDDKKTSYLSIFGLLEINRAYYWQKDCEGICPLDARINLPQRRYSYLLDDWTQSMITEEPFDKAVGRVSKIFGIPVTKLGQENVAREAGGKFDDFYQQNPVIDQTTEGSHIGIEADGKGVRMIPSEKPQAEEVKEKVARRGKGEKSGGLRKMATATADFTFNPQARTAEEMVGLLMRDLPHQPTTTGAQEKPRIALNTTVAASMAGKQVAIDALLERVRKRDPSGKKKIIALMDGDPALELMMEARLRADGMFHRVDAMILDIMHAMEYLWDAGTALYGEKSRERVPWVKKHALEILKGNVGYVIGGLRITLAKRTLTASRVKTLNKTITYFENHQHMMQYDQYLAAGYPIATGIIEGTCGSLIKDRADRSGSRWSSIGAQAVLNERAIMKNNDWDDFWNYHMKTEKERLYGHFTITNTGKKVNQN